MERHANTKDAWRILHAIADKASPRVKRQILETVKKTKQGMLSKKFIDAFEAKDYARAVDSIPWDKFDELNESIPPVLDDVLEKSAKAAEKYLPKGIDIRFGEVNPAAIDFVRKHAGEMITQVANASRLAVRDIIEQMLLEGRSPIQAAREVRNVIGLLSRDALQVDKYRSELIAKGRNILDVDRLTERRASQLLNRRANVIARQETIWASNEGQRELWRKGVKEGQIDTVEFERSFIVTPDDRLCSTCESCDDMRAPIDGVFPQPAGEGPPIHVMCRCAEGLVRIK